MFRIAIVAGEASGDLLGAGLIRAIRARRPDICFEGVAGPRMMDAGCQVVFPAERLSVMGLVEILGRVPEALRIRRALLQRYQVEPPDLFIGIDAPAFNTGLELRLKARGIPTVHYVSPSIWAWRQGRIHKIKRAVDLMLTLFPFEAPYYEAAGVPVRVVGHPLADAMPLAAAHVAAHEALALPPGKKIVALLPGSRATEVKALGSLFLEAAKCLLTVRPDIHFAVPLATPVTRELFCQCLKSLATPLPVTVYDGRARDVLTAADAAIVASGTVTLEAMLAQCPMVVAYRLSPLTFWLVERLARVTYCSIPNLLADDRLVPELVQDAATAQGLSEHVLRYLNDPDALSRTRARFQALHRKLRQGADDAAAEAVLALLAARHAPPGMS
ncbi:MAG TPA: lipid-A-disaccharide synthase [Gammaproteobacteria bacterium]|nr:lipid-A-disaccharide synthase [Gammaproteobacteria bacterium]